MLILLRRSNSDTQREDFVQNRRAIGAIVSAGLVRALDTEQKVEQVAFTGEKSEYDFRLIRITKEMAKFPTELWFLRFNDTISAELAVLSGPGQPY